MRKYICIFCLLLMPRAAHAVCLNLALANVPSVVVFQGESGEYSVFDGSEYLQTVNFEVTGQASGGICDYFVTLSAGQSGNFNQRRLTETVNMLNYNAYVDSSKSSILKALPTATDSEVINGNFPLMVGINQTSNHSFTWTIDPVQIVPAATARYADMNLTLSLYSGLPVLNPMLVTSRTITFQARAESSVDLSLVDSGATFDIGDTQETVDFETLESGEQRGFDIVVRSNNGYRVTMQSANHQTLVHGGSPAAKINYDVLMNGGGVDLSSGAPVEVLAVPSGPGGITPATGHAIPVELTIDTMTGNEPAGTYTDVISVEVSAN